MERAELDEQRWQAVVGRDAAADSGWVYGVRTTGVYCRPGCPSRRPNPENVTFHDSPGDAEAQGLRPCRRCRPQDPAPAAPGRDLVVAACRSIERRGDVPALADLATELGVGASHLQRTFTARIGVSPTAWAERRRAERLAGGLAAGRAVAEAAFDAGFGSLARASATAPSRLGMTAERYRSGGEGAVLRVACAPCELGWVLIAATDRGLAAVELGDDPHELRIALRRRLPRAEQVDADGGLDRLLADVVAAVDGHPEATDLPLDVRGTAFQERVWRALRAVPAGTTVTYGELATSVGASSAVRAVAGACAANPVAVVVPCHRAVRRDGGLGGYRWGVARKRALLEREAHRTEGV